MTRPSSSVAMSASTFAVVVLFATLIPMVVHAPPANAQSTPVRINEFQAVNETTVADNTGAFPDWIELHNTSATTVDLDGWVLTNGTDSFTFDSGTTIPSGGYRIVWASGDVTLTSGNFVHVPFKLSAAGETLTLADPTGTVSTPSWPAPGAYPVQIADDSYGVAAGGDVRFFTNPTPGRANGGGVSGMVAPVTFSVEHGFYTSAQNVTLNSTTPGVTIRYTTNGDAPTANSGVAIAPGESVRISSTATIRAAAYRDGWIASPVETRTYLFTADIIDQTGRPSGFPSGTVNGQVFDYGMDPDVVNGNQAVVQAALQAIPTLSIVADLDDLFDPSTGIYVNATKRGAEWERQASVELIDPSGAQAGFDIEAGLRVRGGFSRNDANPKHSFRLFFGGEYEGALEYALFGDEGDDRFEKVDLRTSQNYAWQWRRSDRATWLDEVWSRDTQAAMGQSYTRSRQYHLYLNGIYWGIYMTQERVSGEFGESYFGGTEDDYDVVKRGAPETSFEATNGTDTAWRSLFSLVSDRDVSDDEYAQLESQVDMVNLADYYLLHFFSGDYDASPSWYFSQWRVSNNWYALRDRSGTGPAGKWQFFDHDSEHSLCAPQGPKLDENIDNTPPWNQDASLGSDYMTPGWLHEALISHPAYRQTFIDRVQLHMLTPGGALTTATANDRLDLRVAELTGAIEAESARWGDGTGQSASNPYGRAEWNSAVQELRTCFSQRPSIVESQLREDGLWPLATAPQISPTTGAVPYETTVSIRDGAGTGTLYYTVDGSDPRAIDGTVSPNAAVYAGTFAVTSDLVVQARIRSGNNWSPLSTASYRLSTPAGPVPLALNEFNAVSSTKFLGEGQAADIANGSDATFGRVLGNGGDWFELVVIADDLDIRGWTVEVWNLDAANTPRLDAALTFASTDELAGLRAGTLVTVSEDIADDVSYAPEQGDWHINLQSNNAQSGAHFTGASQSNFAINNDNTQIAIFDAAGAPVQLRTGEGVTAGVTVGSAEVFKLEGVPSAALTADSALYADGTSSTWGLPNVFGAGEETQDLSSLRVEFGDVNCDGVVDTVDALHIAQFISADRTAAQCPFSDPAAQINIATADLDASGAVGEADALLIIECAVGNRNAFCS